MPRSDCLTWVILYLLLVGGPLLVLLEWVYPERIMREAAVARAVPRGARAR